MQHKYVFFVDTAQRLAAAAFKLQYQKRIFSYQSDLPVIKNNYSLHYTRANETF
jgi:hypothetical protein